LFVCRERSGYFGIKRSARQLRLDLAGVIHAVPDVRVFPAAIGIVHPFHHSRDFIYDNRVAA
jgi:hypothetical protein